MPKIKIKDLPKNQKVSKSEIKNIKGGYALYAASPLPIPYTANTSFIRTNQPILSPISTYADVW